MEDQSFDAVHLSDDDLAAYWDRRLGGEEQQRVEAHLAWCSECRGLLTTTSAALQRQAAPRKRWLVLGPAAAAAAAIILFVALPQRVADRDDAPAHRDDPAAGRALPTPIEPRGTVEAAKALVWHSVNRADRYRGTMFDSAGVVLWRTEIVDTVAPVPDSVELSTGATYLWRVEARIGIDRWVESELQQFRIDPAAGGPSPRARDP